MRTPRMARVWAANRATSRLRGAAPSRGAATPAASHTTPSWASMAMPRSHRTGALVIPGTASGRAQQPCGVPLAQAFQRQQQEEVGGVERGVPCRLAAHERTEAEIALHE